MSLSQSTLRSYSVPIAKSAQGVTLLEARALKAATSRAFLCHSHLDKDLALGVQAWFLEQGCTVYIDWQDTDLPAVPDRTTAKAIQSRIRDADWFFYLATANSSLSVWCPWEMGYADGVKPLEKIIVLPTCDSSQTYGQAYLDLYRHVYSAAAGGHALFEAASEIGKRIDRVF